MKKAIVALLSRFTWLDWSLVVLLAGALLYLGWFGWVRLHSPKISVEYLAEEARSPEEKLIWVDVAGAVAAPGVYQLGSESRVKDALVAAGGLTGSADREYIARVVNLADRLKDGGKIYVPTVKESAKTGAGAVLSQTSRLININDASIDDLMSLSGIGAVRAAEIVKNRPYQKIEELVEKKVVGQAVFDKIKDKLAVY